MAWAIGLIAALTFVSGAVVALLMREATAEGHTRGENPSKTNQ